MLQTDFTLLDHQKEWENPTDIEILSNQTEGSPYWTIFTQNFR